MAIARVQSAAGNTGTTDATTFTITLGSNTTAGNIIVIATTAVGNGRAISPSMTGTQWLGTRTAENATGGIYTAISVLKIVTGGQTVVTVTSYASTAAMCGVAVEYSGSDIHADVADEKTGNSATASGNSMTTTYANELLVSAVGSRGKFSSAQTAWLTSITNSFSSVLQTSSFNNAGAVTDREVAFLERFVTTAGAYTPGGGTLTSGQWTDTTISFREVPSVGITFGE